MIDNDNALIAYLMTRRQSLKMELVHIETLLIEAGHIKRPSVVTKRNRERTLLPDDERLQLREYARSLSVSLDRDV